MDNSSLLIQLYLQQLITEELYQDAYDPFVNVQYQKQERETATLVKKQKTYEMLDADYDNDDDYVGGRKLKFKMMMMMRQSVHSLLDSLSYFLLMVISRKEREREVKRRTSPDNCDGLESEEEILGNQREKGELEQHMRERDVTGTWKEASAIKEVVNEVMGSFVQTQLVSILREIVGSQAGSGMSQTPSQSDVIRDDHEVDDHRVNLD